MSNTNEPGANTTAEDRGISPVQGGGASGRLSMQTTGGKALAMLALVAGCGLFLYLGRSKGDANEEPATRPQPIRVTRQYEQPNFPPEAPSAQPQQPEPPPRAREEPRRERKEKPTKAEERLQASQYAPLMAINGGKQRAGNEDRDASPASLPGEEARREPTALEANLRSSKIDMNRAAYLPNRDLLLTAGSILPCVLQTAMDTTTPGLVACVIPRDVLSESGRVVVMEKGTKVLGEYQGGMRQGQERIFVTWNRAVTPTGIAITLDSPASDQLGRSGFNGKVETYFWTRFGGAMLLSVIGDVGKVGGTYLSDRNIELDETQSAGKEAAAIALENSINIPPVLRKNQGEEVSIFVANDLNFAGVYRLRRASTRSEVGAGQYDDPSPTTGMIVTP